MEIDDKEGDIWLQLQIASLYLIFCIWRYVRQLDQDLSFIFGCERQDLVLEMDDSFQTLET